MARRGVRVTGVAKAIINMKNALRREHNNIHKEAQKVSADLLREARKRAPVREGTLIDSMTEHVKEMGYGRGFLIVVTGGDTPYAMRMHESHYTAHPRSDYVRKTSKKTGKSYYAYAKKFKTIGISKRKRGGISVKSDYQMRARGAGAVFWRDSAGNLHGRKYLSRAWDQNKNKYINALEKSVNK